MFHSYVSPNIRMLIIVVLSLLAITACGDKDESVQSAKSGQVFNVDTPISVPKQPSPQGSSEPSPVGNPILRETPEPMESVPSENSIATASSVPAVSVPTFIKLMDKALT